MIEFLFFAVPAAAAALLTFPSYFVFNFIRSRFPTAALWIAAGVGSMWALGVFVFLSMALLILGVPADENAGEAVVLFLWIGLAGAGISQVVYWGIWFFTR